MAAGKFFVIEGVDGSGKTTQLNLLKEKLFEVNAAAHFTAEPTEGPIGSVIRNVLKKRISVSSATLAGLFLADRLDHLENDVDGMLGMLDKGIHVVSDRYYWSSYAYHSLDLDMNWVIDLNKACAQRLRPHITFYLDLPVDVSMSRIEGRGATKELFEKRTVIERVRENYLESMRRQADVERVEVIDANQSPEAMFNDIWKLVEAEINQAG